MVLGRRELSVILLVFGAIIAVYMVLLAGPTSAQQGGGSTGGTTGQQTSCSQNEELVETFTGNGNQTTDIFQINGDSFRIIFNATSDPGFGFLDIIINDSQGGFVGSASQDGSGSGQSVVNEGPGQFFLELSASNTEYTVSVCDRSNQNNQNSVNQGQSNNVIRNTIPNKPLPPTGGWPVYILVAGSILAGAGLLGVGVGLRRGRR